jgi:DNA-binding transcriptional ArsR family regulator/protein-L-isoaspartate O-methyltransferase
MFKGSTASEDLTQVVRALRGVAEPTRLRLLVLLSHGEYTVGELCEILGQSQPRISRHLRLLTEAGFLDRFREEQCVYYRVPVAGRFLSWSRLFLSMLEPDGAVLRRDSQRAQQVVRARAATAAQALSAGLSAAEAAAGASPAEAASGELAAVLREELGPSSVNELLDVGTGSGAMLQVLAPLAGHAMGIDISAPALRLARTRLYGAGLTHCEFRRGDMYRLPVEDDSVDLISLDRVLTLADDPQAALREAARALRPDGRLLAVEDFEQLESHARANPLTQLRQWLRAAGLTEIRLRPCDIVGRHLIVALARHGSQPAAEDLTTLPQIASVFPRHATPQPYDTNSIA